MRGKKNAPKIWLLTVNGPIETVSCAMTPEAEPEPYFRVIRFVPAWRDVDFAVLNSSVLDGQEMQEVVANHKSDEPVSRTRGNDWGLGTR